MEIITSLRNKVEMNYPSMKLKDVKRVVYIIMKRDNDDEITDAMIDGYVASQARHVYTGYDRLMDEGMDGKTARQAIGKVVHDYVTMWKRPKAPWLK